MGADTGSAVVIERRGETKFAKPFPRALIRDGRLSFAARGFFAFLWDMPANWKPRMCHLVKMSAAGRDALLRLRRELEAVGGLTVEVVRLTREEAEEWNAGDPARRRPYRAGQVVGSRWVLMSPEFWAVEMPLKIEIDRATENPAAGDAGDRPDLPPAKPPLRFTQAQGSSKQKQQPSSTSKPARPSATAFKEECERHGVKIWRENGLAGSDDEKLNKLIAEHGIESVEAAARQLSIAHVDGDLPLPSAVVKELRRRSAVAAREQMRIKRQAESAVKTPPATPAMRQPALELARAMRGGVRQRVNSG